MVKAGIFLLARLYPALSGTDLWFYAVTGTGLVTLLFGAYTALFRHDLKGLLAYSTISHLGLIMLLFGLSTQLRRGGGGVPHHQSRHLQGLAVHGRRASSITRPARATCASSTGCGATCRTPAALAMVAAASMAGVPLLNGFLSKEMFFAETLLLAGAGALAWVLPLAATFAGVFSVRLLDALHPRRVLQRRTGRSAEHAARAAALDAHSGGGAGGAVPAGRHRPGLHGRAAARGGRRRAWWAATLPRVQPGASGTASTAAAMSLVATVGASLLYFCGSSCSTTCTFDVPQSLDCRARLYQIATLRADAVRAALHAPHGERQRCSDRSLLLLRRGAGALACVAARWQRRRCRAIATRHADERDRA